VTNIVSKIGRAEVATDPVGVDAADVFIALKPHDEWTSAGTREELIKKMSEALERGAPDGAYSLVGRVPRLTSCRCFDQRADSRSVQVVGARAGHRDEAKRQ
jgi:hypothetical protein